MPGRSRLEWWPDASRRRSSRPLPPPPWRPAWPLLPRRQLAAIGCFGKQKSPDKGQQDRRAGRRPLEAAELLGDTLQIRKGPKSDRDASPRLEMPRLCPPAAQPAERPRPARRHGFCRHEVGERDRLRGRRVSQRAKPILDDQEERRLDRLFYLRSFRGKAECRNPGRNLGCAEFPDGYVARFGWVLLRHLRFQRGEPLVRPPGDEVEQQIDFLQLPLIDLIPIVRLASGRRRSTHEGHSDTASGALPPKPVCPGLDRFPIRRRNLPARHRGCPRRPAIATAGCGGGGAGRPSQALFNSAFVSARWSNFRRYVPSPIVWDRNSMIRSCISASGTSAWTSSQPGQPSRSA